MSPLVNPMREIVIVTSIHADFDARIWKHATSLVKRGLDVHLVCPWNCDDERIGGIRMHPFPRVQKRWQRPFLLPIRIRKRLKHLVKGADIIHFHDIDLLPYMALLAIFGKHVVYDVHENYAEEMLVRNWPKYLKKVLAFLVLHGERMFTRIVGNVILVTEAQEKTFQHGSIQKLYIKNYASRCLVEEAKDDYHSRESAVVFIGSHYESNGSLLLIDIARKMKNRGYPIPFIVADRFSSLKFRKHFVELSRTKDLQEIVQLTPNVNPSEIANILNKATIAINPVLRVPKQIRAINTKLFEFMAVSLPIVTSDLPTPKQLIEEANCGLLAQPEKVESFVDAIIRLIEDRDLAYRLGQNGQKAILEQYSWESQMPSLIEFYGKMHGKN